MRQCPSPCTGRGRSCGHEVGSGGGAIVAEISAVFEGGAGGGEGIVKGGVPVGFGVFGEGEQDSDAGSGEGGTEDIGPVDGAAGKRLGDDGKDDQGGAEEAFGELEHGARRG